MINSSYKFLFVSLTFAALSACGGGDSSDGESQQLLAAYSGETEGASLSEDDIYPVLNYLFNGDTSAFVAQASEQINQTSLASLLQNEETASTRSTDTETCDNGGKVTLINNINANTGRGQLTYNYDQCEIEGTLLSGSMSTHFYEWNDDLEPIEYKLTFTDFVETLEDGSYSKLLGSLYIKTADNGCGSRSTSNLLLETESMSFLDLGLTAIEYDSCYNVDDSLELDGRIYISNRGYIDITTNTKLILDQIKDIDSGKITLSSDKSTIEMVTTDANTTIRVDENRDSNNELEFSAPSWAFVELPYDDIVLLPSGYHLFIPDSGVLLSQFPNMEKSSVEIDILDTKALTTTTWNASADVDWLTVTNSGTTADKLTISVNANSTELVSDAFYSATVIVNSEDTQDSSTINVGLWLGSTDPDTQNSIDRDYDYVVADPVRPYVYVHKTWGGIDVYNIYTQQLISNINVNNSALGHMEVNAQGTTLYVASDGHTVYLVDLNNTENISSWQIEGSPYKGFALLNSNNKTFLIDSKGGIYDTEAADLVHDLSLTFDQHIGTSLLGNRFCAINMGSNGLRCYDVKYDIQRERVITTTKYILSTSVDGYANDVVLNKNGSKAYIASDVNIAQLDKSGLIEVDVDTMTPQPSPLMMGVAVNALAIGSDDVLHLVGDDDYWLYADQQVLMNEAISTYPKVKVAVSGDDAISVFMQNNPNSLTFISNF